MQTAQPKIDISIRRQRLTLKRGRKTLKTYPISSSRFGLGPEEGSMKTPLGQFRVAEKIGHGQPAGPVCQSRVALKPDDPLPDTDDLITCLILFRRCGAESIAHRRHRFIYIHGTKHED